MRFKTRLKINLSLLAENAKKLRQRIGDKKILFMIKANAYGHGMISIARYSVEKLSITEFGCATLGEALTLRKALADLNFEIYVFSDLELETDQGINNYLENRLIPVLSSLELLKKFLTGQDGQYGQKCQFLPLVLKFDTGMNRLGIKQNQLKEVIKILKEKGRLNIYHLMSHFSSSTASIKRNKRSHEQYENFKKIKQALLREGFVIERSSMANSGAIEQNLALDESHVRPGLILYGPSSLVPKIRKEGGWDGKNISSLETHFLHVQKIKKGTYFSYGSTAAPFDGILAYLALGYGDGITNFYHGAKFFYRGHQGVIAGRVCMDMTPVLFPIEAGSDIKTGQTIEVWGNNQEDLLKISDAIKSIPYEILCGVSERIPRVYFD